MSYGLHFSFFKCEHTKHPRAGAHTKRHVICTVQTFLPYAVYFGTIPYLRHAFIIPSFLVTDGRGNLKRAERRKG